MVSKSLPNKMIKNFYNFINEEVKRTKLENFRDPNISNLFTAAIEIEMEASSVQDDEEDLFIDYTEDEAKEIVTLIRKNLLKELSRTKNFDIDKNKRFIKDLFIELEESYEDDDYCEELLEPKQYKNKDQKFIVKIITPLWISYFMRDNLVAMKNKFEKNLPNFFKKWGNLFKYEIDNTLDNGLEISNQKYFENINTLIECIDDFYSDFENQSFWEFSETTGIHINLGFKEEKNWNIIKGILFLDDMGEQPFVFQNMEWRKTSKFTKSLKEELLKQPNTLKKCLRKLQNNQIEEVEEILNSKLVKILYDEGYKNFGLNLLNLSNNYVEFRYPGGNLNKQTLIDKLLYFCYISYIMTHSEVDKNEYHKKLYKFLKNNIE
jgi:hypothetical protein